MDVLADEKALFLASEQHNKYQTIQLKGFINSGFFTTDIADCRDYENVLEWQGHLNTNTSTPTSLIPVPREGSVPFLMHCRGWGPLDPLGLCECCWQPF